MTEQLYEQMEKLKANTRDYLKNHNTNTHVALNLINLIERIEETQLNLKRSEEWKKK